VAPAQAEIEPATGTPIVDTTKVDVVSVEQFIARLKVTLTLVFKATPMALAGIVETTASAGLMVNGTVLVVTPEVVTLIFVAPSAALAAMANVAVIWVVLATVVLVAEISAPPTFTAAPVAKFVPVRVTLLVCP